VQRATAAELLRTAPPVERVLGAAAHLLAIAYRQTCLDLSGGRIVEPRREPTVGLCSALAGALRTALPHLPRRSLLRRPKPNGAWGFSHYDLAWLAAVVLGGMTLTPLVTILAILRQKDIGVAADPGGNSSFTRLALLRFAAEPPREAEC
jgi:hypothetical protein